MLDGISRSKNRVSPQKKQVMDDSLGIPTGNNDSPSDGKYLSPEARARRAAAASLRNNDADEMGIATIRAPVPDAYLPPSQQKTSGSPSNNNRRSTNNSMNDDFIIAASPSALGRLAREQNTPTTPTGSNMGLSVVTPSTPTNAFGDPSDGTTNSGNNNDNDENVSELPNLSPSNATVTNGRRRQYRTVSNNTINTNATGSGPNSLHSTPRSTQSGGSNPAGELPTDPVGPSVSRRTLATTSQRTIEPNNAVLTNSTPTAASRRTLATTSLRTLEPGSVVPSRNVSSNPTPISNRTPASSAPTSARRNSGGGGFILH